MATIKKKPTKAHKSKKVVKAHQGMAHVPRPKQRPTAPAFARDAMSKAQDKLKTRAPIAPRPQPLRTQIEPAVVQQPIKRRRPPRISDGPLDGGGRRTITPRKLTSREKRRQGNAFKSQADEMFRQYNKQRKPRQPRVAMPYTGKITANDGVTPYNPATSNFPMNKSGAVKKKYAEIKTLKQGGYVSRAKYGSVDNLNKKK